MAYFFKEWGKNNQYQNLGNTRTNGKTPVCSIVFILLWMPLMLMYIRYVSKGVEIHVFTIDTSQPLLHLTSDKFLSFGLDSSLLRDMKKFPIKDEKFVNLASRLSPAYVRFGGTSADCLFFNETAPGIRANITSPVDGQDISNFTITRDDFLELFKFTEKSKLRMMFDLNALIRQPNDNWDDTNAQEIINFAKSHDMQLDWQLGNEPNSFPHAFGRSVTAQQLAQDYYRLRGLLNVLGFQSSIVVGPEVNHIGDTNHHGAIYAKEFLTDDGNSIDYLTWHQYYLNGREAQLKDFIDPLTFDRLPMQINELYEILNATGQNIKMWISETSTAYGGGAPELSDRYVAGFLWLDKLGYSAASGVAVVVRQSLFGGNYAMIGPSITPNPDWWLSVIYKQFVSQKVLRLVSTGNSTKIRLYAHCSPESALVSRVSAVTLYGMNLDKAPAIISLKTIESSKSESANVFLYVLTSDQLQSSEIQMNGKTLKLNADGSIPPFKPIIKDISDRIKLPAYSMVFMVIHGLDVDACKFYGAKVPE